MSAQQVQPYSSETRKDGAPDLRPEVADGAGNRNGAVAAIDWGFWLTLVIAAATVAQAIIYFFQTRLMRASLEATKQTAEVSAKLAVASIEAQRPHIFVGPHGNPLATIAEQESPRIVLQISNLGATPAYGLTYETWIEILAAPFVDFTSAAYYIPADPPLVISPREPITVNIPVKPLPTSEQRQQLRKLQALVCVRMRIAYRDSLSDRRVTEVGYCVSYNGLQFLPKYNCEAKDAVIQKER